MPKSKRNKLVTLSKAKRKGRGAKETLVGAVRGCLDAYAALYVFELENYRNSRFKDLRDELKESSRFFQGSNKVLQVALGRSEADEHRDGTSKASALIHGDRGLFFTNLEHDEVVRKFESFEELDYARTGSLATETVELKEGPLEQFSHDMEALLRKHGMPVRLNKGVVELVADHVVCTEGQPISPAGAQILRLLGNQLAPFRLHLIARWTPTSFEMLGSGEERATSSLEEPEANADEQPSIDLQAVSEHTRT
eukprot:SM000004S15127  [mRNA]  locus=s4:1384075:1386859:- [translate_table: standard]